MKQAVIIFLVSSIILISCKKKDTCTCISQRTGQTEVVYHFDYAAKEKCWYEGGKLGGRTNGDIKCKLE